MQIVQVHIQTKKNARAISWDIDKTYKRSGYKPFSSNYELVSLARGDHTFGYFDSYGDGWAGGWYALLHALCVLYIYNVSLGNVLTQVGDLRWKV